MQTLFLTHLWSDLYLSSTLTFYRIDYYIDKLFRIPEAERTCSLEATLCLQTVFLVYLHQF